MKRVSLILVVLCAVCLLASCNGNKDLDPAGKVEEIVLNVDVILPPDIQAQWSNAINWAQDNIAKAQLKLNRQVKLNLRYHNEDTEDLDALGYALTHPEAGADTCHAILGPYHSDSAAEILKYARSTRLPVLMPTCTSADLQRKNARNTYAWFFTESDITQCEIMLSAAQALRATDIALLYSNDTYGQSFMDWVGYYATEREMHLAAPPQAFKRGDDISSFLKTIAANAQGEYVWVMMAFSNVEDYIDASERIESFWIEEYLFKEHEKSVYFRTIGADTSLDPKILEENIYSRFDYGVCPSGSMNFGFPQSYEGRYFRTPYNGEAQVYDALTLLALGAAFRAGSPGRCIVDGIQVSYLEKPYEPGLTDYMRSVVSNRSGYSVQWDAPSLARGFEQQAEGNNIDLSGATGNLFTDSDTHTKVLNTSYLLWTIAPNYNEGVANPSIEPILYLSTSGTSSEASTTNFWKLEKQWHQVFNYDPGPQHTLPKVTDHWAVVVSPSTKWSNYRHQADAFAMYKSLRQHGYDDDHIVLIVEDNLASDSRNIFPGSIFVERSEYPSSDPLVNEDVRSGAVVDYHFSDLSPSDLADILNGRASSRLPQVIHPTSSSNVLFFWSGHGGSREGPLWGDEDANQYFGTSRIKEIVKEMSDGDSYRRMLFAIETCYSGKWGKALEGFPDVLVLTAASPDETSKADVHDRDLGVYLSNAFARTFRREINKNPSVTIYDLYKELARTTTGSHVNIYNNGQYGSVYSETMSDFFPK